jgi:hypothetical protein
MNVTMLSWGSSKSDKPVGKIQFPRWIHFIQSSVLWHSKEPVHLGQGWETLVHELYWHNQILSHEQFIEISGLLCLCIIYLYFLVCQPGDLLTDIRLPLPNLVSRMCCNRILCAQELSKRCLVYFLFIIFRLSQDCHLESVICVTDRATETRLRPDSACCWGWECVLLCTPLTFLHGMDTGLLASCFWTRICVSFWNDQAT